MAKTWFTSDHHFGHREIVAYESRPFAYTAEMDRELIERWNAAVETGDRVFHLGDFSFHGERETREIVGRLNGSITLVLGNHDRDRSRQWWLEAGFDEVSEHGLIYKDFFLLTHEPLYMNKHMPYLNVHGHIHGLRYEGNNHRNVSVEHWDYRPVSFEELTASLKEGTGGTR